MDLALKCIGWMVVALGFLVALQALDNQLVAWPLRQAQMIAGAMLGVMGILIAAAGTAITVLQTINEHSQKSAEFFEQMSQRAKQQT